MTLQDLDLKLEQAILELRESLPEMKDPRVIKSIDDSISHRAWSSVYWGIKANTHEGWKSDQLDTVKELLDLHDVVGNDIVQNSLDKEEMKIIGECLKATVHGPFFPDWEFNSLFGLEREEVKEIAEAWPNIESNTLKLSAAINGAFNNLIGYPHGKWKQWGEYISISSEELELLFNKWRRLKGWPTF